MSDSHEIRSALAHVPPTNRDVWLRMGMAVKSELGEDGFEVWDEWSQRDDSYNTRDARSVWHSINPNGKVTKRTLFHEASRYGFTSNGTRRQIAAPSAQEVAQREQARQEAEIQASKKHEDAAALALRVWKSAQPARSDHPYLERKGIVPVFTLHELPANVIANAISYVPKQSGEALTGRVLIAPVRVGEALSSLEFIDETGRKSALAGGAKSGGFWSAQKLPDGHGAGSTLALAEGIATALSIHLANGHPAFAALSCGNLVKAAQALRTRYPKASMIVCGDLGNGERHAHEAARTVGGLVAFPDFSADGPDPVCATDFNDMYRLRGREAVASSVANAKAPKVSAPQPPENSATAVDLRGADWPEPQPIQAALHPVEPFDHRALLPDALRDWVMDEAERMPCPPDFIAAATVVALGSTIGARCAIKPKSRDPWLVVPNLWGGVVGLPAAKKSPAMAAAFKPLDRLSLLAQQAHTEQMDAYDTKRTVFDAKREAIEGSIKSKAKAPGGDVEASVLELKKHKKEAPAEPAMRRYKTNDSTVEKLGELLRDNPTGLLVLRDELVGLVSSWDREGREGDRAFFLEAWNGTSGYHTDRIGRGTIVIPNLCLSIFGGIQPDKLTAYLEQAAHALGNDGMLQRFQVLVYPDARAWEWRDRGPNKAARDGVFKVFGVLSDFDPVSWGAEPADEFNKFPHFRFDEEAQEVFMEWMGELQRDRIPKEQTEGQPLMVQHLAKYDSLFPALALVFHLAECAASGARGRVTHGAALREAAWCEYLEGHARRCYGLLADEGLRAAQSLAERLRGSKLANELAKGFTVRDVRRNQWQYLKTDHAIQAALEWLEDDGWLRRTVYVPERGRPTVRYYINPKSLPRDRNGGANG